MKRQQVGSLWVALAAVLLASGCTTTQNFVKPRTLGAPPVAEKQPMTVELRLTDEFRNATWELKFMGTVRWPFGPHLVTNTEECVRAVFANVVTTSATASNRLAAPAVAGAAAVLVPRVVYVDMWGATPQRDCLSMALEWSLYDPAKTLVWIDSLRSEIKGPIKDVKGAKKTIQRRYDLVLGDIFRQSAQAMSASREIRQLAVPARTVSNKP